ncbi:hypothetical protein BGZ76_005320 [Entomortierella beljakovae]|nr:hypothetical protein BGZ76_005320 [Entomortierella beljakovae]
MATLKHVQRIWSHFLERDGFDKYALAGLRIVSASKGTCLSELVVAPHHINRVGGCHGGLLSHIVDTGGSLAIAADGMYATGVSTDLNVSFISGATLGDKLSINSRCLKVGGSLAYTDVEISVGDRVVATGRHTKFIRHAHKAHAQQKMDGEK